jgi:hypothetical protein
MGTNSTIQEDLIKATFRQAAWGLAAHYRVKLDMYPNSGTLVVRNATKTIHVTLAYSVDIIIYEANYLYTPLYIDLERVIGYLKADFPLWT